MDIILAPYEDATVLAFFRAGLRSPYCPLAFLPIWFVDGLENGMTYAFGVLPKDEKLSVLEYIAVALAKAHAAAEGHGYEEIICLVSYEIFIEAIYIDVKNVIPGAERFENCYYYSYDLTEDGRLYNLYNNGEQYTLHKLNLRERRTLTYAN